MKKLELSQIDLNTGRENFRKLDDEFATNPILNGQWRLFDIQFDASGTYSIVHRLGFTPLDCIQTYPQAGVTFSDFSKTNITITTATPARVRFLLGRMN